MGRSEDRARLECGKRITNNFIDMSDWPCGTETWCEICAPKAGVHA